MDSIDAPPTYPPPPPPKKRLSRPKITLQIPETTVPLTPRGAQTAASLYYGAQKYRGRVPTTPASHVSDYHINPFMISYHSKASEFMFKQYEGFKDFTMNTAKSGMSAGEKSAFWFVNKLKILSKKWFTHFFLTLCLVLYSLIGAAVFMALEGYKEPEPCTGERYSKSYSLKELLLMGFSYTVFFICRTLPHIVYVAFALLFIVFQSCICFVFCT